MKLAAIVVIASVLCIGTTAFAQDAGSPTSGSQVPRPTKRRSGNVHASLHLDTGVLAMKNSSQGVTRTDLGFGLRLNYRNILFVTPFVATNSSKVELTNPDKQPFDATLVLPWQFSIGARFDARLFRWHWLELRGYGSLELPTSTNAARVTDIRLTDQAAGINVDAATVRDHVAIRYDWRRFDAGITARTNFGLWHPFLDLGYVHFPGTLTVDFDGYAGSLLKQANVDPAPSYDAGFSSFFYSAGLDVDLGRSGFQLRVRGTAAPINHGWIFTGRAGLFVPLDPSAW